MHPISITAISSISPLGSTQDEVWSSYKKPEHLFEQHEFNGSKEWVAKINDFNKEKIESLRDSDVKYKNLDDSVLFAIFSARQVMAKAGWKAEDNFGVNIGSSRGATSLFESYHSEYLKKRKVATLTSPTTTLGNISSWVAHDLQTNGPEISHSITCSSALHALLNGVAWLNAGMSEKFLVGGSEAPLTPFTLAQMKALKIYTRSLEAFPCQALNFDKKQNTMILGEGAAIACLEKDVSDKAIAQIIGIGYATEVLTHNVSISSEANCFQHSMRMALQNIPSEEIDVIVMHAPGTVKGDTSEYKAIESVFGEALPALTTNKWKVGHTFGASGMLSVELALMMLIHQEFVEVPFISKAHAPKEIKKIMVNAVGFGGNAVSILLSLPSGK